MKRPLSTVLVLAAVAGLLLAGVAACGGSSGSTSPSPAASLDTTTPVTLTVWHPWTVKSEKQGFATAVAGFEQKYPWINLKIVTFPNSDEFDQTLIKNINAGTAPDVAISFGPDYVGKYAADDLLEDMTPFMEADKFDMSVFAPAALSYTKYDGKQVALPVLTDAYGLYYNKTMFEKAGLTGPPKTMSELMDYAKKLTVRSSNGDIEVAGFVPLNAFNELGPIDLARPWGAEWFGSDGKAITSTDPAWASAFTWQKQLVDWYGKDAITKFNAAWVDKEWTPDQVFETGHVAMIWDGEWRTKMIENDQAKIDYATAPFPAADDHPELYGQGRVGGTICGIPRGAANPRGGLAAREVHVHRHRLPGGPGEHAGQRADDDGVGRVAGPADAGTDADVHRRVEQPELAVPAAAQGRGRHLRRLPQQLQRQVGAGEGRRSAGRPGAGRPEHRQRAVDGPGAVSQTWPETTDRL